MKSKIIVGCACLNLFLLSLSCTSYEGISSAKPVKLRHRPAPSIIREDSLFKSDVDIDIPRSENNNPKAIAIVLGVETYRNIPPVPYARNDAYVFKEYAVRVLGVPDDRNHLYFKTNDEVTKAELEKLFLTDGWLAKRTDFQSDIYIYFAGHGAPELREMSAYLIPSDGDPNYPSQTGFSRNRLYDELSKQKARSITIFLDACFTGSTRENKMLLADQRPVGIAVESPDLLSETIVSFAASSGAQSSGSYPQQSHGLFTYFLLKGLRGNADLNNDNAITVNELDIYVTNGVRNEAGLLDREQTPQVIGKDKQRILVRY